MQIAWEVICPIEEAIPLNVMTMSLRSRDAVLFFEIF